MISGWRKAIPRSTPLQIFGLAALAVFLFILYSRVFDLLINFAAESGAPNLSDVLANVPAVFFVSMAGAALFSRGLQRAFSSPVGLVLLGFSFWLVLDIPFSVWRGGSFAVVMRGWAKALLVYVAIAGLIRSFDQCTRILHAIGYAILTVALIGLLLGSTASGRLYLPQGKFGNPNDYAQVLLIGLPFLWLMFKNAPPALSHRVPLLASLGVVMVVLAQTGSRGAFVSFAVILLVLFLRARLFGKVVLAFLTSLVVLFSALLLPEDLQRRYFTWSEEVSPEENEETYVPDNLRSIAIAAAESRYALLQQSIRFTIRNPIFGVGPGMFPVAQAATAKDEGERAHWQVTHNTYTQVSCEAGLPALCLYLAAIILCWRQANSVYRFSRSRVHRRSEAVGATALCLKISLLTFALTAFFSSVAFQSLFPTLAGLIVALSRVAKDALADEPVPG